jgi:DNA-binding NarL/FixJ family response regulator
MAQGLLVSACEVVGQTSDGQSLMEAAMRIHPDVIVTDISMPILNGIEACKQLRELGCEAKVIFLTAHSDIDFVRTCLDAGALGYVVKSRMATDLKRAVQEVLAGRIFISSSLRDGEQPFLPEVPKLRVS